jgi:stage V sporulation protein D (sporulation-specific penicillin-binding protein)
MENQKKRILVLLIVFIVLFIVIVLRLVDIQIFRHPFYERKSLEQRTRIIKLAAQRGDIFDRNGDILATSYDSFSAFLYRKGWLARKLSWGAAKKIQQMNPRSIALLKEKKRDYPKGRLAAQVLGFVGVDNQGLSGIELAFDEYLRGKEGKVVTEGDPRGRELYGALRELEPGTDGMNLTLTIDGNIQYVAEREIEKQIKKSRAKSGMCIVMDLKTGEILALASKPGFNPNLYQKTKSRYWHPRFLDPYEPGSTFKLFTVAAGLEEGVISTETMLRSLDSIEVGGKVIKNALPIDWPGKRITISKMLEKSINTGAVQIGLKLGPERFYKHIKAFGLGQRTGFGLWGESKGILRHWRSWYKPDIGMITFGQGIAVTPMQLLSAVSAFSNQGVTIKPFLVKKIESPDGKFIKIFSQAKKERAVSGKVASEVKKLMRNVVLRGSGRPAEINKFGVCGKTGTAQKVIPGGRGYLKDRYIASFIGFAPYKNPRVAALVIVDDPKGVYWGGKVCAPVFKKVVEYSLRYLNVRPDVL